MKKSQIINLAQLITLVAGAILLSMIVSSVSQAGEKEVTKTYNEILNIQNQIVERSDMRFSDDLAKGDASHAMTLSSQLIFVADDIVSNLKNKIDVSNDDYLKAEKDLIEIKSEMQKLNE